MTRAGDAAGREEPLEKRPGASDAEASEGPASLTIRLAPRSLLLAAGVLLIALLAWQGRQILLNIALVLVLAALFATISQPVIRRLLPLRLPRWLIVLSLFLILGGVIAGMISLAIPVVRAELTQLSGQVPAYSQSLQNHVTRIFPGLLPAGFSFTSLPWSQILSSLASSGTLFGLGGQAFGLTTGFLDLIVVIAASYYLMLEAGASTRLVQRLLLPPQRERASRILTRIEKRLQKWFGAQLLISLYFGLTFGLGLRLLGLPFAFSIGFIGGVFELFPYVGSVLALVLALLVGIGKSPLTALAVLALWAAVIEIESHFVAPSLYGRALHLSPVSMLIALFTGFRLLGVLGLFLAAPGAIVLLVLLDEYYPAR